MEIAVVGSPAFTLGFQLAGLSSLYNPDGEEDLHSTLRSLLNNKSVGIMVVDSAVMATLPERLRDQLSASVSPHRARHRYGGRHHLAGYHSQGHWSRFVEVMFQPKNRRKKK